MSAYRALHLATLPPLPTEKSEGRKFGVRLVPRCRLKKSGRRVVVGLGEIHGDIGPPDQFILTPAIAWVDGNARYLQLLQSMRHGVHSAALSGAGQIRHAGKRCHGGARIHGGVRSTVYAGALHLIFFEGLFDAFIAPVPHRAPLINTVYEMNETFVR